MGIDAGFDMVPQLSKGAVDRRNWKSFINAIKEHYQNDSLVEIKVNYVEFKAGEHPLLPFEGHKFLRFSSKISGSHAEGVQDYIDTVTRVARCFFGSRVRPWNDAVNEGFYSWTEVNGSFESYEQPDEPEIPTSIAQYVLGTDPLSELNLQLYTIQSIPGKGKGLVARFNIAKGTRILCEKPLFTTPNLSPISLMETNVITELKSLPKSEQRKFLSLHNNFPSKHIFSGIVRTNALPCGSDSVIGGVYPTICFINHSCLPNTHNSWNSDTKCETIHAVCHINAGEEITISYDKGGSSEHRRTYLKDAFGFDCNCSLCSLSLPELRISDARRLQIQQLDDTIGDPERVMNRPHDPLADCQRLLQIIEEEYDGNGSPLIARLYYDAFQISITHGEDSPETRRIKNLMENPARHRNFEASKKWKTAKRLIPKGLDSDNFEKWLWRRGK
ncbi:hypothetical protein GQ44DRAFT_754036 [Phaeosphaeriaceae sp. PMI808]|nr:hypothetical protein GQ44DRAFT_754036 [Phaeosphaeriaceae sp. PMI808]